MYLFVARREIVLLDGGRYQFSRSRKIEREREREVMMKFPWVR